MEAKVLFLVTFTNNLDKILKYKDSRKIIIKYLQTPSDIETNVLTLF